jgi:N-acetylneuraminic acid mutarotase
VKTRRGLSGILALALGGAALISPRLRAPEAAPVSRTQLVADTGIWIAMPPLQMARQEVGVAALDGKLYVVAGISSGVPISSVEVFDLATSRWSFAANLPGPPLDHVAASTAGGKLYIIGGFAASGSVRTVFEYDPAVNRWARKADLPTPRGAAAAATIDGRVYAAGGYVGADSVTDFARYDPVTDQWEVLPPMPTARDHHVAVALAGRFHAIAGRRLGANLAVHEVFDPTTGRWTTLAPLPTPRSGLGGGTLRGRIQVFGGEGNRQRPDGTFAENEEYDPVTNTWRPAAPMPLPRHGLGGAVLGTLLFAPGGGPREGLSDTAAVHAFRYRLPPSRRAGLSR